MGEKLFLTSLVYDNCFLTSSCKSEGYLFLFFLGGGVGDVFYLKAMAAAFSISEYNLFLGFVTWLLILWSFTCLESVNQYTKNSWHIQYFVLQTPFRSFQPSVLHNGPNKNFYHVFLTRCHFVPGTWGEAWHWGISPLTVMGPPAWQVLVASAWKASPKPELMRGYEQAGWEHSFCRAWMPASLAIISAFRLSSKGSEANSHGGWDLGSPQPLSTAEPQHCFPWSADRLQNPPARQEM